MAAITVSQWCLLVIAALIIGVSKTGFPGVGILAIPLAAMVWPARASTGLILPMLITGDLMATLYYRRQANTKYLAKLVPCAVIGILIGAYYMGQVKDSQLKPIIGGVVLVLLVLNMWRNWRMAKTGEIHVPRGWWFPVIIGTIAGITTMMANAAGPIMIIYLLAMRLPKDQFIGTGAWYFLALNTIKVPFSWYWGLITPDSLMIDATLAAVIITGGFAGLWLVKFIPEKSFTWIVQLLTVAAALQLLSSIFQNEPAKASNPAPPATAPVQSHSQSEPHPSGSGFLWPLPDGPAAQWYRDRQGAPVLLLRQRVAAYFA